MIDGLALSGAQAHAAPDAGEPAPYTAGMRTACLFAALAFTLPTLAQTPPPQPDPIGFRTVADALQALEARDGNGTVVAHADGWTIINEPLASAQWSFTSIGHHAHPAVVRRVIKRSPDAAVSVDTTSLCEAPAAECSKLLAEFAAMNDRVTQAVKARARQGSTQPPH